MPKDSEILKTAGCTFAHNFPQTTWFGRCIFISWYCDVGTCQFCYRSTQKSRITHASKAKRSIASILVEALLSKHLNWRIEFLTGGYKIYPKDELIQIIRLVNKVYGQKIWLNLGAIEKKDLDDFRPYIKGIVSSIETLNPTLHNKICPNKPIEPYEDMFSHATDLKKSMTIVIGLGEKKEDFELLKAFITKHNLERITFYALKPITGTPYTKGPDTEDYVWWIANTRISFPKLEIIAGTTYNRVMEKDQCNTKDEVLMLMKSGANAITKFPATKKFNTEAAKKIEAQIAQSGRQFTSTLTRLPDVDWDNEIEILEIDEKLKEKIKAVKQNYIKRMSG